ncbi:urea transporter [Lutibacter sp.]|uniref:urea transporter n=1 Tax=Lutibacter sp. TaxID=1925666 RepID=UPI0027365AD5|nr:urea transporter [Lutibacter sp.]MDP3311947.1 urea transporter [Lutibacter sp.]
MKNKLKIKSALFGEAVLTSYAQIFFTDNKILASILVLVSFIDWWIGLSGLIAVTTAVALAELFGYSQIISKRGLFSFNSLLVGLGVGTYFLPGLDVLILIIVGSAIAFFSTIFLMGFLAKYSLPFLSVPFLIGMWLMLFSFPSFGGIALNTEALYPSNMFFKLGGNTLVFVVDFLNNLFADTGFETYFLSLGAIFFQFNILAGVLIAIGLLIHSRVIFLLSLVGFFVAYWFYSYLGMYQGTLNYTYYGFNFILSAIAIGGYFLIPSKQSFLWSMALVPVLVITTVGTSKLFGFFEMSVFSLPFNLVIISVLYAFKIRFNQTVPPILTLVQQKNPETNAYLYASQPAKKFAAFTNPIRLPFLGQWTVNQGHEGFYTHKDFFKYAWDFVIKDETTEKEFLGEGLLSTDYFCFDKPVIAPASGTVVAVLNAIDDNEIGIANTIHNWGNTVVIKHDLYLYTKMCHLKKGSVEVKVGDIVSEGQVIGKCGNSGRSPYPHLHFQVQSSAEIGSPTMYYPLFEYLKLVDSKLKFTSKGIPKENEILQNISTSDILESAFRWNPGDEFNLTITNKKSKERVYVIKNVIDSYNLSSLHCISTGAVMYYSNNGKSFSALNYVGTKKSPLFYMYSTFYKVIVSERSDIIVTTPFPVHQLYRFPTITIQDFLVPIGIFLKGNYKLTYTESTVTFNVQKIEMNSKIEGYKNKQLFNSNITVHNNRTIQILCTNNNNTKIQLKWENRLV